MNPKIPLRNLLMKQRECWSRFALLLSALLVSTPTFAGALYDFSPTGCEFNVNFPEPYETRKIITQEGLENVIATSRPGQYPRAKLIAECWPIGTIGPQEFAENIHGEVEKRGVKASSVTVVKEGKVPIVVTAGTIGHGLDDQLYFRMISHFGTKSRLD